MDTKIRNKFPGAEKVNSVGVDVVDGSQLSSLLPNYIKPNCGA